MNKWNWKDGIEKEVKKEWKKKKKERILNKSRRLERNEREVKF